MKAGLVLQLRDYCAGVEGLLLPWLKLKRLHIFLQGTRRIVPLQIELPHFNPPVRCLYGRESAGLLTYLRDCICHNFEISLLLLIFRDNLFLCPVVGELSF